MVLCGTFWAEHYLDSTTWVLTCFGSKGCRTAHNSSDTRKSVVTLFTGARWRRFLLGAMHSSYQIWIIRIGTKCPCFVELSLP